MKGSFYDVLINTLQQDSRFISNEGILLKNKIKEYALKMDSSLIDLLFENEIIREKFFKKVGDNYIFDKVEFSWMINNKEFLPNNYTKYGNKIHLATTNDEYLMYKNDVVLTFPYKDCLLEFDSTDENEKRDEIFYNESLASDQIDVLLDPKVFTNINYHTKDGIKKYNNFNLEDNLLIKGNNLLVLASLLPVYEGKIKCIYWDVLYNTNSDYVPYNDSFKHSSWLVMMKNRLEIAKKLLKPDGLIFISIDDNEQAYLSVLMDEVFGRDNSFDKVSIQTSASQGGFGDVNPGLISNTENLLIYIKDKNYKKTCFNEDNMYIKKDYDENYKYIMTDLKKLEYTNITYLAYERLGIKKPYNNSTWRKVKEKYGDEYKKILYKEKAIIALTNKDSVFRTFNPNKPGNELKGALQKSLERKDEIYIDKDSKGNERYILNGEIVLFYSKVFKNINGECVPARRLTTFWDDLAWEGIAREGNVKLNRGKKPEKLIKRIIEIATNKNDIVLDAYLGSGTTCAVAHKLGRKYIGIEQLDNHFSKSLNRMKDVINGETSGISSEINWSGGGTFLSMEVMSNNQKYIDKITHEKTKKNITNLFNEIIKNAYINNMLSMDNILKSIEEFKKLELKNQKKFLINILDKNMLYVNYSDIEDKDYQVSSEDKKFNYSFYGDHNE